MSEQILKIADDFWNIRGSFKIGGVVDIGTHASLIRRANGKFVFLDALRLQGEVLAQVLALTNDGQDVEAVLNLHPFHTVYVRPMHETFPAARLYGTRRHQAQLADLPWEAELTEEAGLHEQYAEDLRFSVPRGVEFVSADPKLHFSSVLALHKSSGTIHVDDTLSFARVPGPLGRTGLGQFLVFHPTLGRVLERRAGAAAEFRRWAKGLIGDWAGAQNLCTAHNATLLAADNPGPGISARIQRALDRVERTLLRHEKKYG